MKARTKRWLFWAAIVGAVLFVGGVAVLLSGVVPIKASSGHFAITEFVLQVGKRRSISLHTLRTEVPELDDPALVLRGAGHFEGGCRPCHGAPDLPRMPRVGRAMLPHPPNLSKIAPTYPPEELFYIVKHGIKFTGMPMWPALGRDDEVWAVVAFLQLLPPLDAMSYRRLVHGDTVAKPDAIPLEDLTAAEHPPVAVRTTCARCHGLDGRGRGNAAFPVIAGQRLEYLRDSLHAYAEGRRHSGIMETAISGLDHEELETVARYYAAMPAQVLPSGDRALVRSATPPRPIMPDSLARGRLIANEGIPDQKLPACVGCHGPAAELPESEHAPILAGQYAEYLVLQLQLFKHDIRGGSHHAHLMDPVVKRMTEQQMRDVALYYSTLPTHGYNALRR